MNKPGIEEVSETAECSEPRYGSVADMAARSGLSQGMIRNLIRDKLLRSFKVGRRVLISYSDLDRYIESQGQ